MFHNIGKGCGVYVPPSDEFASNVVEEWGGGGVAFLVIPSLLVGVSFAVFFEEVYYVMLKSNSKMLRNALLWIMSTYPAIMLIALVGLFVPRAVVEVGFMYNIYEAYAIYKYYYLIIVFAGGTIPFVEKSRNVDVRPNAVPCPCFVCLPPIRNSAKVTETVKWLILQYVVITPLCGAIAVILRADGRYYRLEGTSPAVYLSLISATSTLICIYGMKLLFKFTIAIEGMESTHAIRGKTLCIQLASFVVGFEALIFNILAQFDAFPCNPPLNFQSNRRVIYNCCVIYQMFILGIVARHFYRRSQDIQRQVVLHDDLTIGVDYAGRACVTATHSLRSAREYDAVVVEGVQNFGTMDSATNIRFNSHTQAATVTVSSRDDDRLSIANHQSKLPSKTS